MAHKIEHNGAKNGGGAWERRTVAKRMSRKLRREEARRQVYAWMQANGHSMAISA